MSLVNDSLLTTLCLQYRPEQVAAAVVYIAYMYMGLPRLDIDALETDETVIAGKGISLDSDSAQGTKPNAVHVFHGALEHRFQNNSLRFGVAK